MNSKVAPAFFSIVFGSVALLFGLTVGVLFGSTFLLPASALLNTGIILYVTFFRVITNNHRPEAPIFIRKNILWLFLLVVAGMFFLNGLASFWLVLWQAQHSAFALGEAAGGLVLLVLAAIAEYFIFRKIFMNVASKLNKLS